MYVNIWHHWFTLAFSWSIGRCQRLVLSSVQKAINVWSISRLLGLSDIGIAVIALLVELSYRCKGTYGNRTNFGTGDLLFIES